MKKKQLTIPEITLRLLRQQLRMMTWLNQNVENLGIFDDCFLDEIRGLIEIDEIALDCIGIPRDTMNEDGTGTFYRERLCELLDSLSEEVELDGNDIINSKEIDLVLFDYVENILKKKIEENELKGVKK